MIENFMIAVNAVVPFLIYITLGYASRQIGMVREEFLKELNTVIFRVFFPFVMFHNLYKIDFNVTMDIRYILFALAATGIVIGGAWLIIPRMVKDNAKRGVMIQAIYRSNAVLFAIPLSESIMGSAGAEKASVLVAFLVPVYNVIAIVTLEYFRGQKVSFSGIIKSLVKNPLILGAALGLFTAMMPVTVPGCIQQSVSQLASLVTPIALFVLGGTLKISDMRKNLPYLVPATVTKLIFIPMIVIGIMYLLEFSSVEILAVFCMFGTPVATASFTMAQNMGGDGELAGELVVLSTLGSIFTIFGWIVLLKMLNII